MYVSEKKNAENHPQPLPSIESSFPGFGLKYQTQITDLLIFQNERSFNPNIDLSFSKNVERNECNNNIVDDTLTSFSNPKEYILNQSLSKNGDYNTSSFVFPLNYNSSLTNDQQKYNQQINSINLQTKCFNNAYYEVSSKYQSANCEYNHFNSQDMKYSYNGNDNQTPNIISILPADKMKENLNEAFEHHHFNNTTFNTKTDLDSSNNSPSITSINFLESSHKSSPSPDNDTTQTSEISLNNNDTSFSKENTEKSMSQKTPKTKGNEIIIDPNKLGFLPRDFWIKSGALTLDQLKRDFFRARSSKCLRFEFKLWNALAITKHYPSLFMEVGVKWVSHVLIMVHRDVFGKLLNVSRPSAALFSSCGAFMTHGFIEVSLREAKQRLRMMSANNRALANPNYGIKGVFYQNQSSSNGYFYGPNIYSNALILPIQSQAINYQQLPQVQQLPVISNSNPNLSSFNPSPYPYPNQNIQSDSSIRPIVNPMALNPAPDIDFELPSEIDESIIRLFTHKTGEFTEDSHANEIIKCKWSNESRSQIKNFKI